MQTGKITALYARFSFDDGIDTESGSIEHQKALLKTMPSPMDLPIFLTTQMTVIQAQILIAQTFSV